MQVAQRTVWPYRVVVITAVRDAVLGLLCGQEPRSLRPSARWVSRLGVRHVSVPTQFLEETFNPDPRPEAVQQFLARGAVAHPVRVAPSRRPGMPRVVRTT